jgi:hypothetical protein
VGRKTATETKEKAFLLRAAATREGRERHTEEDDTDNGYSATAKDFRYTNKALGFDSRLFHG